MNIGIITFHHALNTGAFLQAYALQNYLESLGHKVEFIDYQKKRKYGIRSFIAKSPLKVWRKCTDRFRANHFSKKRRFENILNRGPVLYRTLDELKENPPEYDIYIAGSDQIWNVGSGTSIEKVYYLDFGNINTKRIAFAASLGQGIIPTNLDEEIKEQLLKFDALSIREKNGVDYIQKLVGKNKKVEHLADPTFLLNAKDYLKIAKQHKKQAYIVSYVLSQYDKKQFQAVEYIKEKIGKQLINLRNPDTCIYMPNAINKVLSPAEWLGWVNGADFVICCSFHIVVFSLILHKPFVVVTPYKNQRIISLLASLELTERIIYEHNSLKLDTLLKQNINWEKTDSFMKKERERSIKFLNLNLN